MTEFQTQYQVLPSCSEDDEEELENNDAHTHHDGFMIHVVPPSSKARWNHIENLDEFFIRVYQYHQRHGFACMVLEDILQLLQFVFVVIFSTFLIECVDYNLLFANERVYTNGTVRKITIPDVILPFGQCIQKFDFMLSACLLVALVFWILRVVKVVFNVFKYLEMRSFYITALKISSYDLPNMTWHEVQRKLLAVQKEQQMCIHKTELTELDIYHRILRFKNYTIAMVNKIVLPLKFNIPFVGNYVFLSTGLKYNMEFLLFWGPWSAFDNKWHLKDEYKDKNIHRRKQLAERLAGIMLWLGLANLALCPLIFLWQILYFFFRYAELVKNKPAILGARRWSNYARQYLRHYNELDHEFDARMSRGYHAASMYVSIFTSPFLTIIAKNIAFFAGSILAVLVVLTVMDEDVLTVEHILATITVAGVVVTSCRVLIPQENTVYSHEILMRNILAHIHYIPDNWKGNAHTYHVRDEFSMLFQYKAVYLLEELFSPIITPIILIFCFKRKAAEIVEFFHYFTVEVVGVGDVCSFAQMDIRKHGNPQWVSVADTDANQYNQGEDGKIELSLMHFHLTNPEWKPPENCSMFINNVKEQVHRDLMSLNSMQQDVNGIGYSHYQSLVPNGATGLGIGYTSLVSSITGQSAMSQSVNLSMVPSGTTHLRGTVSQHDGPGVQSVGNMNSIHGSFRSVGSKEYDEGTLELMSNDMSYSALFMHDSRTRRGHIGYDSLDNVHARAVWQRHETSPGTPSTAATSLMPDIQEEHLAEVDKEEGGN
ncbi:hypothetical protein CHS0354_002669 [Potamilus streckersoni]|uniref:Autophagy-related protein 9 n=1 Tax=Potamilus streckersoni TaxID=2493646 RepID=A0AAE0VL04_9BIVA|nr:hypothetical protein CHS0354_002669 [Potamilus streckersoni]